MMHFEDKVAVISKIDKLLNASGIFCLSIDKNQSEYIDMGTRKIKVYPDNLDYIISIIVKTAISVVKVIEAKKQDSTFDTSVMESEIDSLVYKAYCLNVEEIQIIEHSV